MTEESKNNSKTMDQLCSEWLEEKKKKVKPTTYSCYETIVDNHLLGFFSKNVSRLSETDIEDFITCLTAKNLKVSTIHSITYVLRFILRSASRQGLISDRVVDTCSYRKARTPVRVCSGNGRMHIKAMLLKETSRLSVGLLLMLSTGIRVGELCGLRWENFDFMENTFEIVRTVQRIKNTDTPETGKRTCIYIGPPKTESSMRKIPVPTQLLPYIRCFDTKPGQYFLTGTVFCMEPRTVQRQFQSLLRANNLPHYNLHSLRHGFASISIENGVDCKTVSSILGHSSTKITLDLYVHCSHEMMQKCIDTSY